MVCYINSQTQNTPTLALDHHVSFMRGDETPGWRATAAAVHIDHSRSAGRSGRIQEDHVSIRRGRSGQLYPDLCPGNGGESAAGRQCRLCEPKDQLGCESKQSLEKKRKESHTRTDWVQK